MPRFSAASPRGRSRSINTAFWAHSCTSDTAKLQATVVTPEPPLPPRKTNTFPPGLLEGMRVEGRREDARDNASFRGPSATGCERNSRAPERMQLINRFGSLFIEKTMTATARLAEI